MMKQGLLALAVMAAAGTAFAQDAGAAGGAVPERRLVDLIAAGGLIGHVIILCSIAGMAIAIENLVALKQDKLCPPHLVAQLETLLDEGRYDEAVALCEGNRCYIANVVGPAVARSAEGYDSMVEGMEGALEKENLRCMQKISLLALLGNLGPMLGLTGTVTGMIAAFTMIEQVTSPPPAMLAKGIYEALVTTAEGLFLAIPILTVYFVLRNRVQALSLDLGTTAMELVGRFRPGRAG